MFQLPDFAAGPYSVICDFDGTVTPFDVTDAILERFARPAWKTIEDEWVRGAISARQCMERQIPLIEAPLERLDAFLDTVPVTGGFVEFVRYSRSKGIPLGIVSDGMDYHQAHLNRHGLPCPRGRQPHGLQEGAYRLNSLRTRRLRLGCASAALPRLSRGRQDLLIGDGLSDCCLARSASFTLVRQGGPAPPLPPKGIRISPILISSTSLRRSAHPCRSPSPRPPRLRLPRAESFAFGTNSISKGIV
ncbi:MAG: HAD-IB family phosphatase [Bilophila wadsworthia]